MTTTLKTRDETQAVFTVTLDEADIKTARAHTLDELRGKVRASGFRPGKAPDYIVERELGAGYVQGEVVEHAVRDSYADAVRELELPVIAPPSVEVSKFVPYTELEYNVTVDTMPKVKLGDYKAIRVERKPVAIDPAMVDATVEDLRRREAARIDSDGPAKLSDEVNFDFEGTKDGQPVPGAAAKGHTLQLGSGQFIPGFEDELVGMKKGDEKTFTVTFPAEYHEPSLAGQPVQFKVKVNAITELVLPELNDEFVERVSPFKSVDELRDDIAQRRAAEAQQQAARAFEQEVIDQAVSRSEYSVPKSLMQQQLDRLKGEMTQNLAYSGLDLDKYLQMRGQTQEELEAELEPEAKKRVGLAMVLTEVAREEEITVSADELDAEVDRLKSEYKDARTQAELDNPETREEIYNHLMASRVIARLSEYAEGQHATGEKKAPGKKGK